MAYILMGSSGVVVFNKTGTITDESPQMSSTVTSNPIEGGGKITDHAVLEAIKFSVTGIVTAEAAYTTLQAMWKNRDLLTYRGAEAFDNLLITSLKRTRNAENLGGYGFTIAFQQITITSAALVNIKAPTMSQQNKTTAKAAKPATKSGLVLPASEYSAYVAKFNNNNVNTSLPINWTNPSYAGYGKGATK